MQCKDVPERPVLEFMAKVESGTTATWYWSDDYRPPNSVANAMPAGTNGKLALAKMKTLIRKGVVSGCGCGCRGNFELTDKGRGALASPTDPPLPPSST